MNAFQNTILLIASLLLVACTPPANEVNVYSARKENLIRPLLDQFSAETGIKTNLLTASADKLLTRMVSEGVNSPADVLITVDAGRLYRAQQANVLQPIESALIEQLVPKSFRQEDNYWIGLSKRSRVIFYAKDRVKPEQLSSYEALADLQWKGRICIRGSDNIYNQSLVASMIINNGTQAAQQWADSLVKNLARPPQGGDRDQIRAAAAGQCDLAIANTYYFAQMLSDKSDPEQAIAASKLGLFWPNQEGRGAHVNISGAAISKHSPNPDNATKLVEFLASESAQQWYAVANHEFPVSPQVKFKGIIADWLPFKADNVELSKLGELNAQAVKVMDRAGWQ